MIKPSKILCALLTAGLLSLTAACGGGGGGGGGTASPTPPPNTPPIAEAGDTQTVEPGTEVSLDGSASSDADGNITSYAWTQTDGPEVDISNADAVQGSFIAPSVASLTDLVFTLTVTDNDGASTSDSVTISVGPRDSFPPVAISGRILISDSQSVDGDTNDPFNPLLNNDSLSSPQRISNPITLGGYVNEPGSGAEGRSQIAGDREDYFLVDLLEGQRVNLVVAEFQDSDADLYLYSADGELLDFSIETGELESIAIESSGRYVVNVSIFAGATNYTLAIGSGLTPVSTANYDDVIPEQVVVTFSQQSSGTKARDLLAQRMQMREVGGGPRREQLMAMDTPGTGTGVLERRLGAQRFRYSQFADNDLRRRWDTLVSIKHLARTPGVIAAEPNYRVYPTASVNDDAYRFQWHYPLISVPGAWDTTTGDPGVIVAVIDTGILSGHPDLAGQLVAGYDFVRDAREAGDGDGIDPNPEETVGGADPAAINFHGTHVAGTIAARGNNRIGVVGVAFDARVMPLRAITATGGTTYDVNQAVRFAAGLENDSGTVPERPAQVINMSLAGGGFSPSSQQLYNQVRARGITVVAAAGNEDTTVPSYPASYDNVISVSAVDTQQRITDYSNTGPAVDIAAPGGDGSSDINGDGYPDGVLSTGSSDGEFAYTFLSGTSMATPHVAGVFALMHSVNPDLDAAVIEELLETGALTDDIGNPGRDDFYGYGIINARKAVDAALIQGGGSSSSEPRLGASSSALNFGSLATQLDVVLSNSGSGSLENVQLISAESWITVAAVNTDSNGLGRYSVAVTRDALAPGVYEGRLQASSSANSLEIRVLLAVSEAVDSNLGQIYLLLYDPQSDEVVAQALVEPDSVGYRYALPPSPAGDYQLFAGTDLDNDLLICDPGEACGSYLTIDQPLTISINADRGDLDFPIEYLIALPGTAATAASDHAERYPELKRTPD
jgi:serine protease